MGSVFRKKIHQVSIGNALYTEKSDVRILKSQLVLGWFAAALALVGRATTAVPEPHEYAMVAGLGLVGFAAFRRWRLKMQVESG